MQNITIDEDEFDLSNASLEAQAHVESLQFVNEQILQRNNELTNCANGQRSVILVH